jgi:hypothetical protein
MSTPASTTAVVATEPWETLVEQGYIVVPIPTFTEDLAEKFKTTVSEFPEYLPGIPASGYTIGGFGALGVASSFHHELIRHIREVVTAALFPILRGVAAFLGQEEVSLLIDRVMARVLKPGAESWHRDMTPITNMLGGWFSVEGDSFFSCVPTSHVISEVTGTAAFSGFMKIDKEDHADYKKRSVRVSVPAGSAILFVANIVHEVLPEKPKETMWRLFLSYCFGPQLPYNAKKYIKTQTVPPLPSGQIVPMYAKLHKANWPGKLEAFAVGSLKPEYTETRVVQSGADKGKVYIMPVTFGGTSRSSAYAKYSKRERRLYTAKKSMVLRISFLDDSKTATFSVV